MSKSRQEKTKTPAQSAPPPPVSNDVVPGRFTESDWNQMLDVEDAEDFIFDIVQEIVESTMSVLHDKYIESQTLPYTVQETRQVLLDIIEWQFLACDTGEDNPSVDPTWLEEDEPIAPTTDSWAQGSVPVIMPRPVSTESSTTSVTSEAHSEDSCIGEDRPEAPEPPLEDAELVPDTPLTIPSPVQPSQQNSPRHQPKPPPNKQEVKKKRRGPFKKHKGKLPEFSGVDLTSVTDVCITSNQPQDDKVPTLDERGMALLSSSSSILKTQYGRPPGNKDVVYDEWGNVAAVIRLNPEKLPSHRVRTKFTVVDQTNDSSLKPRKTKTSSSTLKMNDSRSTGQSTGNGVGDSADGLLGPITPLPPPLVDSMDINAGVVVREGDVVRRGPVQVLRKIDRRISPVSHLQPLDATASARVTTEPITRTSPIIRPLHHTDPIPPIPSRTQSA